jgi:enamidase
LNSGHLRPGKDGDVLLVDAPMGGSQGSCLKAIKHGDVWSLVACFTQGRPRFVGRSRNTPPPLRYPAVTHSKIINDFASVQQFS